MKSKTSSQLITAFI
jgi:sodium/potassium-transporting ATPase subunit alpha